MPVYDPDCSRYDCFTGELVVMGSIALEKASVLFNAAAIASQLAVAAQRDTRETTRHTDYC